jgi:hypothetical protein
MKKQDRFFEGSFVYSPVSVYFCACKNKFLNEAKRNHGYHCICIMQFYFHLFMAQHAG